MINQAKNKLNKIKNIKLDVADVEQIPHKENTFDYVTTTEAFHHFPNPKAGLNEMHRVLKKNGVLAIVDINFLPLVLTNLLFKLEPGFVRMYSKKEFEQMLHHAGFTVLKQMRVNVFGLITLARKE